MQRFVSQFSYYNWTTFIPRSPIPQESAIGQQWDHLSRWTGIQGINRIGNTVSINNYKLIKITIANESSVYTINCISPTRIYCLCLVLPKSLATCRTLNNNNLTTLPKDLFSGMARLRALRLSDNPFACDCHLSWLSRFLRSASRLAPYTKCHSPSQLKGQNVGDLHDSEFKCSGIFSFHFSMIFFLLLELRGRTESIIYWFYYTDIISPVYPWEVKLTHNFENL